nr:hypothetical protein [Nonlabens ulvanivorans]
MRSTLVLATRTPLFSKLKVTGLLMAVSLVTVTLISIEFVSLLLMYAVSMDTLLETSASRKTNSLFNPAIVSGKFSLVF